MIEKEGGHSCRKLMMVAAAVVVVVVAGSDPRRPMESCCYFVRVSLAMEKTSHVLEKKHSSPAMSV